MYDIVERSEWRIMYVGERGVLGVRVSGSGFVGEVEDIGRAKSV